MLDPATCSTLPCAHFSSTCRPSSHLYLSTVPHIRRAVPEAFEDADRCGSAVSLAPSLDTAAARSSALAAVARLLLAEGLISGWREELYPVVEAFDCEPVALVERAAAVCFGIKAYGAFAWGGGGDEDARVVTTSFLF